MGDFLFTPPGERGLPNNDTSYGELPRPAQSDSVSRWPIAKLRSSILVPSFAIPVSPNSP